MTDRQQVIQALSRLAIATRERVDEGVFTLYTNELVVLYSAEVVCVACSRLVTTAIWFPKVAEVIKECKAVKAEAIERERRAHDLTVKELPLPMPNPTRHAQLMSYVKTLCRTKAMR